MLISRRRCSVPTFSTSCPTDGDIREAVNLWCSDPAAAEEQYGHISTWDVTCVTNMEGLFRDKNSFNEDIGAWDVSSVRTMQDMFHSAEAFNQPLAGWDVSKVENMGGDVPWC